MNTLGCKSLQTNLLVKPRVSRKVFVPKANIINNIKAKIPKQTLNRTRLIELSNGRLATSGLVLGTLVSNMYGLSFSQQFKSELGLIFLLSLGVYSWTIAPRFQKGVEEEDVLQELKVTRLSMVMIAILFSLELFNWN
jgi:hypothetical protein